MFYWHKEMERLDVQVQRILRLKRSLSDVQVALPGFPSQEATAYLCAFAAGSGVRVAVALHLHASRRLAFYLNEKGEVGQQEAGKVMNEGVHFAESMGFILGDLDFQLLGIEERLALWDALPLRGGEPAAPPPAGAVATKASARPRLHPEAPSCRESPTPEAMRARLRENLGRFLASF